MVSPAALDALRDAVGASNVVTDPDVMAPHTTDWTGRWHGQALAVVRPIDTAQVQALVVAAQAHGFALVPQGGNTGLVGGATPAAGEVVVDLRHLDDLEAVDPAASQVTVGAGVTLQAVQEHVAASGLSFPVDLGARATATIGGMVATNAGGLHVLRHGSMRAQVLGVEAVSGHGEVVEANLAGLLKDNTGYDLAGLLCGSEGTLGIVTRVRLRLCPRPAHRAVALLALPSFDAAVAVLPALRAIEAVVAIEVMRGADLAIVRDHLGHAFPLDPLPAVALLVEVAGTGDLTAALTGVVALGDADVVAIDSAGVAALWRWREAHPEAVAALGVVHKADVTLRPTATAEFVARVDAVVAAAGATTTLVYGHLGDGNLHVNLVGPAADDDRAVDGVLELVLELGGSISAEHGIGRAKRRWLALQRGPAAVALMRATKAAWDPDGILNPGVLLPSDP